MFTPTKTAHVLRIYATLPKDDAEEKSLSLTETTHKHLTVQNPAVPTPATGSSASSSSLVFNSCIFQVHHQHEKGARCPRVT